MNTYRCRTRNKCKKCELKLNIKKSKLKSKNLSGKFRLSKMFLKI